MASVNKVILIGNLGSDPEVKYTPSGTAVANFNVATNESWVSKDGKKEEKTEWHKIVVWSKLAELCGEYLAKGRPVYLEGRLQTRDWNDKDGNKRYTTEIVAQTIQFLGSPGERGERGEGRPAPAARSARGGSSNIEEAPPMEADDDIPF